MGKPDPCAGFVADPGDAASGRAPSLRIAECGRLVGVRVGSGRVVDPCGGGAYRGCPPDSWDSPGYSAREVCRVRAYLLLFLKRRDRLQSSS